MVFVYLVPAGFFTFEFIALLLLGGGLFNASMDPQAMVTFQCGCWSIAVMSIITIIYICINFRKQVKKDRFLDIAKMFPGIFGIHMGGGSVVFILFSLLLGGAKGGVFNEVFWFLELCGYILAIAVYSLIFCGIAIAVLSIPCFLINRKMRKEDAERDERIRQYRLKQEEQKQQKAQMPQDTPKQAPQKQEVPSPQKKSKKLDLQKLLEADDVVKK